jgi:hypothetical protein
VLLVSWLLVRGLEWFGRLRLSLRRDRLAAEFSRELRRRGLLGSPH